MGRRFLLTRQNNTVINEVKKNMGTIFLKKRDQANYCRQNRKNSGPFTPKNRRPFFLLFFYKQLNLFPFLFPSRDQLQRANSPLSFLYPIFQPSLFLWSPPEKELTPSQSTFRCSRYKRKKKKQKQPFSS